VTRNPCHRGPSGSPVIPITTEFSTWLISSVGEVRVNHHHHQRPTGGIFGPVARHITNLADQEDRLQEAVCMTYEMAARCAERSQVLNETRTGPAAPRHAAGWGDTQGGGREARVLDQHGLRPLKALGLQLADTAGLPVVGTAPTMA
jgi:hypothetical protein